MPRKRKASGTTNIYVGGPPRRRGYTKRRKSYRRRRSTLSRWSRNALKENPAWRGVSWRAVPRNDATMAAYGRNWKVATDAQRDQRRGDRFYGRGKHHHHHGGGFWKQIGRKGRDFWRTQGKHVKEAIGDVGSHLLEGDFAGAGTAAAMQAESIGQDMVQHQLDHMKGRGMYTSGGRGAYNSLFSGGPPVIGIDSIEAEHGNIIITDSEKVKDIYGLEDPATNAFETFTLSIQPGDFNSFPKLSQTACDWKEYEMISCVYYFKSTVPETYTTTELQSGRIYMNSESNLKVPPLQTADQFDEVETATIGPINSVGEKEHFHGVECDPGKIPGDGHRYIRTRYEIDDDSQDKYDHGRFQFGVFGTQSNYANKIIGELHVSYKVILKNHRMYSFYGFQIPESLYAKKYGSYGIAGLQSATVGDVTAQLDYGSLVSPKYPEWNHLALFKDYSMTADRLAYSNLQPLISNLKVDPRDAAGTQNYVALGNSKAIAVRAPSGQIAVTAAGGGSSDVMLVGKRACVLYTPVCVTFPSSTKGDFEIIAKVEGENLPPMVQMDSSTETLADFQAMLPTKLSALTPSPRKAGNVRFNHDMLSSVMDTSDCLAPSLLNYDVVRNDDSAADKVEVYTPRTDSTFLGGELSCEQKWYDVTMSPDVCSVKCHVHLGVAINSLGDNTVELWVPVAATVIKTTAVSTAATTPTDQYAGLVQAVFDTQQSSIDLADFQKSNSSLTNITKTSVQVRQYNAQQKTGMQGMDWVDAAYQLVGDYAVKPTSVQAEPLQH